MIFKKVLKRFLLKHVDDVVPWYEKGKDTYYTSIGKYSAGNILNSNHPLIERVGAFCSIAEGVCVHGNHAMQYISTHPMLYKGSPNQKTPPFLPYEEYSDAKWFFPGVHPKGKVEKEKRITIGNDVWLGRNVIIVNYSNLGNGVIAAAGAVITKDVPDYAIVAGVPAKIIRYRYNSEQIAALNEIKWWDWSDDEIRARYEDFYLPIEDFIAKYKK